MATHLKPEEYNSYYATYINLVEEQDIVISLKQGFDETFAFLNSIPEERWVFSYAEGKWNIKEIVQHLLDTERVFTYRALSFSRKETQALPGYDQDEYLEQSNANSRTKESLIEEYKSIRNATITLYKSFNSDMLMRIGTASGSPLSVRAAGYITAGHEKHHCKIIQEKYL